MIRVLDGNKDMPLKTDPDYKEITRQREEMVATMVTLLDSKQFDFPAAHRSGQQEFPAATASVAVAVGMQGLRSAQKPDNRTLGMAVGCLCIDSALRSTSNTPQNAWNGSRLLVYWQQFRSSKNTP